MAPGLGASAVGGLGSLTPYRPYFIVFAILMLGWTLYRHFKNRVHLARPRGAAAVAAEFWPRTGKDVRLYLGVAVVVALMTFPQWGRPLLAQPKNPCAAASNPCGAGNPCAASGNPCAALKNPCAAAKNPCAGAANPCSRK